MLRLNPNTLYKINNNPFGKCKQEYDIYYGEILGAGGFSTVFRAKCRRTGEDVAVKEIKKDVILKEGLLERVTQEINIQAELDHSAVLKLYTAFEDADHIFIVLELCSKGELRKYVSKLSEKEVREFVKQIVHGLIYLHGKNILHRDIKLSNILLNEDMGIKIADFGLATKLLHPDERHMTMCGTPNYISPEVVSRKTHGFEADLWSLGILLYTLLVGRPPFETDTVRSTLSKVIAGEYFMPSYLSQPAKNLISCLLQKEPLNRLHLHEVLQHPFFTEDDSFMKPKWISTDSGVDTGIVSSSNNISSKFHSFDRKQKSSNHSDGYYSYDTPKTSRRCRSQERKIIESRDEMIEVRIDKMTNFDERLQNYNHELYSNQHISKKPLDSIKNHRNDYHTESAPRSGNPSCQMFYENEILNKQNCNFVEFNNYKVDELRDNSKNSNSYQYFKNYYPYEKPPSEGHCKPTALDLKVENPNHQRTSSSESVFTADTVKVIPFNTERLKSMRHRSKNVILSILESGEVCVEFLRNKSKKDMVVEVCRIAKDGLKMSVYYPNKGRGVPPSDSPPPIPLNGADAVFNCETLSKENWKKYTYAARFVEMVQTKTPKITLYTEKAKCVLMENKPDPDFEIIFYEGPKITKSRKGIKLTDNNGVICVLNDTGQEQPMNSRQKMFYLYFKQCFDHCRLIEEKLSSTCSLTDTFFKVFPAILGKKPVVKEKDSSWDGCNESPLFHSTKLPT